MSEESKLEKIVALRTALGVSELKEGESRKPDLKEAVKAKLSKLKKAHRQANEKALKDGILIYDSESASFDPDLDLNGQAKDRQGKVIVCRQLSYEVMERRLKGYSKDFSTVAGIEKLESLSSNKYDNDRIAYRSAYYNLFQLDNFGVTLQGIAQILEKGEECNVALNSESHSMAISIRHKLNGSYVVRFFDPSRTSVHRRALCENLDAVSKLSIKHFLKEEFLQKYFPKFKSAVLCSKIQPESNVPPVLLIDNAVATEDRIYCFLDYGWKGDEKSNLSLLMTSVLDPAKPAKKKFYQSKADIQKTQLKAKSGHGYPGLSMAMCNDHGEAVENYCRAILDSKLSHAQKKKLLTAKAEDGDPGLLAAFREGSANAVRVYTEMILESKEFTDKEKIELLSAKNTGGIPGLQIAIERGGEASVIAYTETILKRVHTPDKRRALLDFDTPHPTLGSVPLSSKLSPSRSGDGANRAKSAYRKAIHSIKEIPEKIEMKTEFFKQPQAGVASTKPGAENVQNVQTTPKTDASDSSEQGPKPPLPPSS